MFLAGVNQYICIIYLQAHGTILNVLRRHILITTLRFCIWKKNKRFSFSAMHLIALFALSSLPLLAHAQVSVTSVVTVSSAPQPTSASYTNANTFRDDMLFAHNFYRNAHNASDLTWNDTSARAAQSWGDGCEFEHSVGILFNPTPSSIFSFSF